MPAALTAWSYSRFSTYETCPLQFKLRVLEKAPMAPSPAMVRGDRIHKSIASYVMGGAAIEPDAVAKPFPKKLIQEFRAIPAEDKVVEQQWGFTVGWAPTGWFGKDTWFRSIQDAVALYEDLTVDVLDWKTGKKYATAEDQMELNALSVFLKYKPATAVTTRMVYLDAGVEDVAEFTRADAPKLVAKWEKKVVPMFTDTVFAARPNDKCRFCDFSKSNGGVCRYG